MKTKQLKEEISLLPLDQRVEIADYILETLNRPDPDIEEAWAAEASHRLDKFRAGRAEPIQGEQVHRELRKKYTK